VHARLRLPGRQWKGTSLAAASKAARGSGGKPHRGVLEELRLRGLIQDITHENDLANALSIESRSDGSPSLRPPVSVYCGFDPTADSLHLGNLLGIVVLSWFSRSGHAVVGLLGGATGLVGDPSGKRSERPMLSQEEIARNTQAIGNQLKRLIPRHVSRDASPSSSSSSFASGEVAIVNNLDWFGAMPLLTFLREVGKAARVGTMLAKDSVKSRMTAEQQQGEGEEDPPASASASSGSGSGISFTEFSYQLLQGYDFLHLYRTRGCRLQVGGSDQWGNITAGTDLIRKMAPAGTAEGSDAAAAGGLAFGLTFPLLVGSDGRKFGKSEGGAVWLDAGKTSPFQMYQHLLRTEDRDVVKFLKMMTFLDLERIAEVEAAMDPAHPEHGGPNAAQKLLAEEVTRFVHGEDGLAEAREVTRGLFDAHKGKNANKPPTVQVLEELMQSGSAPSAQLDQKDVLGCTVVDVLTRVGLQPSKSAARRMIKGGGIRVNNQLVKDDGQLLEPSQVIGQRFVLLAAGKKNKVVLEVLSL